jgi:hypothetical protein
LLYNIFIMTDKETYKKRYKMNTVGKGGQTTTVAIPPEVIEKKATEVGLSPEEFTKQYHAIAQFNGFEGVLYTFERPV